MKQYKYCFRIANNNNTCKISLLKSGLKSPPDSLDGDVSFGSIVACKTTNQLIKRDLSYASILSVPIHLDFNRWMSWSNLKLNILLKDIHYTTWWSLLLRKLSSTLKFTKRAESMTLFSLLSVYMYLYIPGTYLLIPLVSFQQLLFLSSDPLLVLLMFLHHSLDLLHSRIKSLYNIMERTLSVKRTNFWQKKEINFPTLASSQVLYSGVEL